MSIKKVDVWKGIRNIGSGLIGGCTGTVATNAVDYILRCRENVLPTKGIFGRIGIAVGLIGVNMAVSYAASKNINEQLAELDQVVELFDAPDESAQTGTDEKKEAANA